MNEFIAFGVLYAIFVVPGLGPVSDGHEITRQRMFHCDVLKRISTPLGIRIAVTHAAAKQNNKKTLIVFARSCLPCDGAE